MIERFDKRKELGFKQVLFHPIDRNVSPLDIRNLLAASSGERDDVVKFSIAAESESNARQGASVTLFLKHCFQQRPMLSTAQMTVSYCFEIASRTKLRFGKALRLEASRTSAFAQRILLMLCVKILATVKTGAASAITPFGFVVAFKAKATLSLLNVPFSFVLSRLFFAIHLIAFLFHRDNNTGWKEGVDYFVKSRESPLRGSDESKAPFLVITRGGRRALLGDGVERGARGRDGRGVFNRRGPRSRSALVDKSWRSVPRKEAGRSGGSRRQ